MTTISTMVWRSRCSYSCRIVSCKMGRFGGGDFRGVVDGQGRRVGESGGMGVPVVPGPSVHCGDSGQTQQRDLKSGYSLQLG